MEMKRIFKYVASPLGWACVCLLSWVVTGCSDDSGEPVGKTGIVPIEVTSPMAEYHPAKMILMHTPGNELLGANGRTKKFDVEAMREEHLQYMDCLRANGIQVFELTDVLEMMPMTQLRTLAQTMFTQDVSELDKEGLIRYMIETPPLKGLYYTRDQSISTPRGQVICKMAVAHRKHEPSLVRLCYQYLGNHVVYAISGEGARMEGGDYLPFGTLSFVGEGLRTNRAAILELLNADVVGHDTLVVVKDALRKSSEMHLDTYFNIIDKDLVALSEARLEAERGESHYVAIDIYARKPGTRPYHVLETDGSLVQFLQKRGVAIIPVPPADQERFACNFLCIAPRHIVARQGLSADYAQRLEEHEVEVDWVKLDELVEGVGAAHCMTQVISRQR